MRKYEVYNLRFINVIIWKNENVNLCSFFNGQFVRKERQDNTCGESKRIPQIAGAVIRQILHIKLQKVTRKILDFLTPRSRDMNFLNIFFSFCRTTNFR